MSEEDSAEASWISEGPGSYESVVDESVVNAASAEASLDEPPKRAKSRAPLRRRRRRAIAGALEGLFDTRRGHGKIVLSAVCVGVIVLALGVGFTVRHLGGLRFILQARLRVDQQFLH